MFYYSTCGEEEGMMSMTKEEIKRAVDSLTQEQMLELLRLLLEDH